MRLIIIFYLAIILSGQAIATDEYYEVEFKNDRNHPYYHLAEKFWLERYEDSAEEIKASLDSGGARIELGTYDIDNDGVEEIISTLTDANFCGSGGCMISIIKPSSKSPDSYYKYFWLTEFNGRKSVASTFLGRYMRILKQNTNNYHDIVFPRGDSDGTYFKWNDHEKKYEICTNCIEPKEK